MAIYKYDRDVAVKDDEDVILEVILPDPGSAASHLVDVPGPNDFEGVNNYKQNIGKGADLKKERTIIFTKAVNLNHEVDSIRAVYKINGQTIVEHSNPKSIDPSPLIKVIINFK